MTCQVMVVLLTAALGWATASGQAQLQREEGHTTQVNPFPKPAPELSMGTPHTTLRTPLLIPCSCDTGIKLEKREGMLGTGFYYCFESSSIHSFLLSLLLLVLGGTWLRMWTLYCWLSNPVNTEPLSKVHDTFFVLAPIRMAVGAKSSIRLKTCGVKKSFLSCHINNSDGNMQASASGEWLPCPANSSRHNTPHPSLWLPATFSFFLHSLFIIWQFSG